MSEKLKYPVDKQTFEKIINGGCVYVDKTDLVYKLTHDYDYVFLSRPLRFGKSVLCSTLKEYFEGNRDLFWGLKIEQLEKDWTKYPVLHFSFAKAKDVTIKSINLIIDNILDDLESQFGLTAASDDCGVRFSQLIKNINKKTSQKVVIIIDEYDAPMLDTIDNDELQEKIRAVQNKFFAPLKDLDPQIRFVFLTGITKFSQMSIFSALNNLQDISLMPEYEALCGISQDELLTTLKPGLEHFADTNNFTLDLTVKLFKSKYNGYHFSHKMQQDIFNPFSVIKALNENRLNNYWFSSGTPSALLKLIKKFRVEMFDYERIECDATRIDEPVEKVTDLVPFLFQSGYLTIKDYRADVQEEDILETYTLGYPNGEVRTSIAKILFKHNYNAVENIPLRDAYVAFRRNDDVAAFIEALKKFFRKFPYSLNNMNERHYHSLLYTILTSYGADVQANVETALGKSDLLLRMPQKNYVIELKYDRSAKSALAQIDDRDYYSAFLDEDKPVAKLAIKFSSEERNIVDFKVEEEK